METRLTSRPAAPDTPAHRYTADLANRIEARCQERWARERTFAAPNPGEPGFDASRPKKYVLDMFPYPSGAGLHVGHPLGYIATDIFARFYRMTGHNVLHAMGYDAFGLPAEQYAVQTNTHPRITTERNIATMRAQLRRLGLGHDARRSVATTDVGFYRWTQWIFLQIYHSWFDRDTTRARPIGELVADFESGRRPPARNGESASAGRAWRDLSHDDRAAIIDSYRLAYLAESPVNWCPALGTVLANEEVTADGRSERGNHPVYKRPMRQWMMRITEYADRLLADLDGVDWPEPIKLMQRNWIGRSEGASIAFPVGDSGSAPSISVFTTRPDTIYGATYMVLAPEHPLVDRLTTDSWGAPPSAGAPGRAPGRASGSAAAAIPSPWTGRFPGAPANAFPSPREAVNAYRAYAAGRTDVERQAEAKQKTGVFTGAWAVNPASGARIPIFIADYVLMGYGTGAIMAVPAHDDRDFAFAKQFDLPIRDVVYPRVQHAISWFLARLDDPDAAPMGWELALADFLGYVFSKDLAPSDYPTALEAVKQRRAPAPDVATLMAALESGDTPADRPEAIGGVRGAVQMVWIEALQELLPLGFAGAKRLFAEGGWWARQGEAFTEPGLAANSPAIDDLPSAEARPAMTKWLADRGVGGRTINYKLRDWLFSRQRYWGEPFPIVYDDRGRAHALPESMLPVTLPDLENFQPEPCDENDPACAIPQPPLARAKDWVEVTLDLGDGRKTYRRELNTMPQWAGSCWYYLRYLDPENEKCFCSPEAERYWMLSRKKDGRHHSGGVDLYVGGAEHAVLHLLYARFWHKVLFDLGHVSTPEPFGRLFNQGYIQAAAYTDARGVYVPAEEVVENPAGSGRFTYNGEPVTRDFGKMGKSLKNSVTPDDICRDYGADTLRLYEMYMGPLDASKPWNTRDIIGVHRFLQRVWRLFVDEESGADRVTGDAPDDATRRLLHKTIAGVRDDLAHLRFNTSIAKLIELTNHLTQRYGADSTAAGLPREVARPLALLLAPLAPHMGEELWQRLGHEDSLTFEPFPEADPALLAEDTIEVPVQVNGKVRGKITLPAAADEKEMERLALADERVQGFIEGKSVKKVIVVKGRMVNVVVG